MPKQSNVPETNVQDHLFQRIKELLPSGKSLVDVVSEELHLSQDSAYRRIRGETGLVLDETRKLCQKFSISLDQLFELQSNSVVFHYTQVDPDTYDFNSYLNGILQAIKELNNAAQKNILYLSKDVPLFHLFALQPLFAFRHYFWMRTTFEDPELRHQKFSFRTLTPEMEATGKEILSLYNHIPSIEIWNTECIHSTLWQIDYCRHAGLMTQSQAFDVVDSLQQMLEHLQGQAEYGRKFLPGENPHSKKDNYQLYYNRIGLGDEIILTQHNGSKTIYINHDALDYMTSVDETYCNKVYQKMQTILRRSTLISTVSEKQRSMFFNRLYSKLPVRKQHDQKLTS